jgi:hypothetical protein
MVMFNFQNAFVESSLPSYICMYVCMYVCMHIVYKKFCSGIALGRSANKIVLDKMVVSAGCHFRVIQRFCKYAWQFGS